MVTNSPDTVAIVARTLLAAGFIISGSHRQPDHIEFYCERVSRLGPTIQFLIAVTDSAYFTPEHAADIRYTARNQARVPVLVSADGGDEQLTTKTFLNALGGAVPSWRALAKEYGEQLLTAAANQLPPGLEGEPWQIFENLVADGLEFCLGRRVNRLGGQKRGQRVSDIVAPLPDLNVIVVDAKASASSFDAGWPHLRPLVEYTNKQKARQSGGGDVIAALLVSSAFKQDQLGLSTLSREFLGETRIPLCFMTAATLKFLVESLRAQPDIRMSIRWNVLFSGAQITTTQVDTEIAAVLQERCDPREF